MANEIKIKTRKNGEVGSVVVDPWVQEISKTGKDNLPKHLQWDCKYQFSITNLDQAHFGVTAVQASPSGNRWEASTDPVNAAASETAVHGYTITITKPGAADPEYPSQRDIMVDPDYRVRP